MPIVYLPSLLRSEPQRLALPSEEGRWEPEPLGSQKHPVPAAALRAPVNIRSSLGEVAHINCPWTGPDSLLPKPVPGTDWHKARLPAHLAPILVPGAPPGGGDREVLRRLCLRQGVHVHGGQGSAPLPQALLLGNLVGRMEPKHWRPQTGFKASSIL